MMMTDTVFKRLKEHKPITINYGKGILSDEDIKEVAYYDETIQKYRSEDGIWSNKLLREIANGEVVGMVVEDVVWFNMRWEQIP